MRPASSFCTPQLTHRNWKCCQRWSWSSAVYHNRCFAHLDSLLLHLIVNYFNHLPANIFESCRSLWRVAWTIFVDMSWAWARFMTLSCRSFTTLAVISAMEAFAMRFLWLQLPLVSHPSSFDNRLQLPSRQGLVMVHLLYNFLNLIKLFLAVASVFMKSLWRWIGYHWSGESWGETA